MPDTKPKTKTIKVKNGFEGDNFMWHGGAVGLTGRRKEFEKLKSGSPVDVPYETACRLINGKYFIEVKTTIKAKTTKKEGDE